MQTSELASIAALLLTLVGTSWKLHSEISSIKINLQMEITSIKLILERLVTRFEEVDKLEKRVDRLEKKVFHMDNSVK